MKKFEYKIITLEVEKKYKINTDLASSEALLTGEGLLGWEAISTFQESEIMGGPRTCVLMKRELIEK